jgi:hypothetical protein
LGVLKTGVFIMDVDVASRITKGGPKWRRLVVILIGVAAVMASCIATLQVAASEEHDARSMEADVLFRHASGATTVGLSYLNLQVGLKERRNDILFEAARVGVTLNPIGARELGTAIWRAESIAFRKLHLLADRIAAIPDSPELPEYTASVLQTDLGDRGKMFRRSKFILQRAEESSGKEESFSISLFLVAVAAALLGLTGVAKPSRSTWVLLVVGCLALVGAGTVTATALAA